MHLCVWSGCRYTSLLSNQHSRCLRLPGGVFILCRSLICSGFEPFRPEEQLLSAEGEIFLVTNLVTPLGNRYIYQLLWSSSILELLSESRLHLQFSLVRFAIWLSEFWFETFGSVHIWIILTFNALFLLSIHQFFPWSDQFLTWSFVLLCVLDLFREPHMCCW